jgi:hypothetical protein
MSEEELNAEEQSALEAMQNEQPDEPVSLEKPSEQEGTQVKPEGGEETDEGNPEFKSTREDKPPEGYVPHQAMHAERVRRQEVERQLNELTDRLSALEKPKDEPPQYVDPLVDPEGFRKYDDYRQQKLADEIAQITQAREQEQQIQQRVGQATRFEQEFRHSTPDYDDAAKFLQQARWDELAAQGYQEQQIARQIAMDANALFDAGVKTGMNPAQLVYLRAQQAGYTKAVPQQSEEAAKVTALAEAQKNTQGIGTAGGEATGKLTITQLAEMSEDEIANVPEAELQRVMGG